jgi:hypothetical protein
MTEIHCFTSFTYTYLARARTLAQTLKAAHPDWRLTGLVVDRAPPELTQGEWRREFDEIVLVETLDIPDFTRWIFGHGLVEACTAVKGHMLTRLLAVGTGKVFYLDPDIAVFHPLDRLAGRLDKASIVLTPHQTAPNDEAQAIIDNELAALRHGVFNLGFFGVRNDDTGHAFARWWSRQLYRACFEDVENGIFTDQKYCDLVPALFPDVCIERDPGCNVASWNLSRRRVTIDSDGVITVNGSPLQFYHFTKIGGIGDAMTERYAGDNAAALELWYWYKRRLLQNAVTGIPDGWWYYGCFDNGTPIPAAARLLYRSRPELVEYFRDPFDTAGDSFYAWLDREMPELLIRRPTP